MLSLHSLRVASIFLLCAVPLALFAAPATTQTASRLQLRLVASDNETAESESLPAIAPDTPVVRVLVRIELDERDVESAKIARDNIGQPTVGLTMTDAGAEKLAALTEKNIDKQMAFVLDGKVLCAPIIRSKISRQAIISLGSNPTESAVKELVEKLNELIDESQSRSK